MGHGVSDVIAAFAAIERARAFGEEHRRAAKRLRCDHCYRVSGPEARGWEAELLPRGLAIHCPHCGPLRRVEREWRELASSP